MDEAVPGPWAVDPATLLQLRIDKAKQAYQRQDFDNAFVEAEELLDDHPTHPEGLLISGQAALAMGDSTTALAALSLYTEHHSPTAEVLLTLAAAAFESVDFPRAVDLVAS